MINIFLIFDRHTLAGHRQAGTLAGHNPSGHRQAGNFPTIWQLRPADFKLNAFVKSK